MTKLNSTTRGAIKNKAKDQLEKKDFKLIRLGIDPDHIKDINAFSASFYLTRLEQ